MSRPEMGFDRRGRRSHPAFAGWQSRPGTGSAWVDRPRVACGETPQPRVCVTQQSVAEPSRLWLRLGGSAPRGLRRDAAAIPHSRDGRPSRLWLRLGEPATARPTTLVANFVANFVELNLNILVLWQGISHPPTHRPTDREPRGPIPT